MPSAPASKSVGWSPFVMQTFMHSPHFTQRFKNSLSPSDPGGRTSAGSCAPVFESGVVRSSGTATIPETTDAITRRLPRSMAATLPVGLNPKLTAFWGHMSSQFLQTRHSVSRHWSFVSGWALPWHAVAQTPQEVQPSLTDLFRSENRERMPKNAPRGQRYLHQNRFSMRFRPMTTK